MRAGRRDPRHREAAPRPAVALAGRCSDGRVHLGLDFRLDLPLELRVDPRVPVVGADRDRHDRFPARPGPPAEGDRPGAQDALTGEEVGVAGRHEQGPGLDPRHRLAGVLWLLAQPVGHRVLVAVVGPVQHPHRHQPLHVGHAVPAGDHQPGGEPVLHRQGRSVHLVGDQHVVGEGVGEGEGPLVVLLDAPLEAVVRAGEGHVDGVAGRCRVTEQGHQRHAGPVGGAHGAREPRLADGPGGQLGTSVAGALHGDPHRAGGHGAQRVEVELDRPLDAAVDAQPPHRRVDRRDVVVAQHVVQSRRRELVAHRLGRHGVVAPGQLQLLEADALTGLGHPGRLHLPGRHCHGTTSALMNVRAARQRGEGPLEGSSGTVQQLGRRSRHVATHLRWTP